LIPNKLAKNLEGYLLGFDSLQKKRKHLKYIEKEKKRKKIHLKEKGLNL